MKSFEMKSYKETKHFKERSSQRIGSGKEVLLKNLDQGKVYPLGANKVAIYFGKRSKIKNLVVIVSQSGELITTYHCDSPKKFRKNIKRG